MDTYFYYGIVQNMVMYGYEYFLRIFMKKFEKTQSMSPLVQSMFFTMPLTSIDVLLHREDVLYMGRTFSIWGGCSVYGEDVLDTPQSITTCCDFFQATTFMSNRLVTRKATKHGCSAKY